MPKAVLISIRPKWCELIASGEKTIEVRKTRPNIETPFVVYIYETKARSDMPTFIDEDGHVLCKGRGQVIGEFVCDEIKTYPADDLVGAEDLDGTIITEPKDGVFAYWIPEEKETCLAYEEILAYGNGKTLYGWHISGLKIYDKPRELSEFYVHKYDREDYCDGCVHHECHITEYPCCECLKDEINHAYLYRAPQSWMFVEEV